MIIGIKLHGIFAFKIREPADHRILLNLQHRPVKGRSPRSPNTPRPTQYLRAHQFPEGCVFRQLVRPILRQTVGNLNVILILRQRPADIELIESHLCRACESARLRVIVISAPLLIE